MGVASGCGEDIQRICRLLKILDHDGLYATAIGSCNQLLVRQCVKLASFETLEVAHPLISVSML